MRGIGFGDVQLLTIKRILAERLDELVLPSSLWPTPRGGFVFVRPPEEFAEAVSGGVTWN